jgi:putative transposase
MQIAHKIQLVPNNKQKTYLLKACGTSRFVWNWALVEWEKQYLQGKKPSGMGLKKEFNAIKKKEFPWTKEVTKYAAQQPFLDLQDAYKRFWKKLSQKPKFKKKGKCKDSFYVGGDHLKIKGKKIWIPNLGFVRMRENLRFEGKINSAVFSRTADRWFASVQVDSPDKFSKCEKDNSVGVDLGINKMVVLSNKIALESPKPLKKNLRKLARFQRKLKKKKFKSSNYNKQKIKVAKVHARVACIRKETLHKTTTCLTKNYLEIGIEDLNVKGMIKNHKLARAISDVGFGEFRRQLEYKAKIRGNLVKIHDRFFPSSKTCSGCKKIKENLTLKDRIFTCEWCGLEIDRDLNSAINLDVRPARPELTPAEMTAMRRSVYPIKVTSIAKPGNKQQIGVSRFA